MTIVGVTALCTLRTWPWPSLQEPLILPRFWGNKGIVIVGTSTWRVRGNEISVPCYACVPLAPVQNAIRSSCVFTKTSPRPGGEGGFSDPFQADQRNASTSRSSSEEQKRKPLCALAEMKCQKCSVAPPTSTLSEKRVDDTFWARPRPTR